MATKRKLDPVFHRELLDYVKKRVYIFRGSHVGLVYSNEWDDIIQEIAIHVWGKINQLDPKRPWKPWVCQIVQNQLINHVRNRAARYKRLPVTPLTSRIVQDDAYGEEEMVYEPDMAMPEDRIWHTREAISRLDRQERVLLETFVEQGTWAKTRKLLRLSEYAMTTRKFKAFAHVRATI